jgi:hypothetical protein
MGLVGAPTCAAVAGAWEPLALMSALAPGADVPAILASQRGLRLGFTCLNRGGRGFAGNGGEREAGGRRQLEAGGEDGDVTVGV